MSTGVFGREGNMSPSGIEAPLVLLDNVWAHRFSEAMAYGYGYQIDITISNELPTSMTSLSLTDSTIQVQISSQLIETAEAEHQLDFLGFNVLHELGHVKRFVAQPQTEIAEPKDAYFQNIVDDIAINYDVARKTRFFNNLIAKAYDQYLYPIDQRGAMSGEPRHKQFMESLLLLGMTTNIYRLPQSPETLSKALDGIGCGDLDIAVVEKLSQVVNFEAGKDKHNLLQQIREYGEDLTYYSRIVSHIKSMYDELYEEDIQDANQQPGDAQPDEDQPSDSSQFDYSNSGGCQHAKQTPKESDSPGQGDNHEEGDNTNSTEDAEETVDMAEIGRQIGKQMAEAIAENEIKLPGEQKAQQLSAEQLERFRKELELEESDFQAFLDTVNKYRGEIYAITDLILQLRRERQDNFLAPSHEVLANGHRIHVGKLLGYLASGSEDSAPDIWKTPAFLERVEYVFDGADFYFLCDTSRSMQGDKAEAASESAVVLSQGIQDASLESYGDVPPVRIQVQAFGLGDQTLCELTDAPNNADLGRMYTSLRNPNSNSTQVSGALSKIKPKEGRLSVVLVLSDGKFHDETQAIIQAKRLEDEGAVVVQCVFGGAVVGKLSDSAKHMNIHGAKDLPNYLFGIMPELVDILRRSTHA